MTATSPIQDITERALQKNIISLAKGLGWKVAFTWNSLHSPAGWPDLVMCRDGALVVVECKREPQHCRTSAPKGIVAGVTAAQQEWLDALAVVPGVRFAGVVRPSMWYAGVLDEVLR